ncbi:MAG: septal ring lytic transglycosylase RlpA family protein [Candidatus Latescibacteria bacterium]|nr:septal ring lytic transglycosylase RlpA family protein [Candidatus Latescibacterota bacterium]
MERSIRISILLLIAATGCATTGGPPRSATTAGSSRSAAVGGAPRSAAPRAETGIASFYDPRDDGATTASGERYDGRALTAAHPTLPFGTRVRVTNLENDRSVVVRINDRGPFTRGRIIDLSLRAARELGFVRDGIVRVHVRVVSR